MHDSNFEKILTDPTFICSLYQKATTDEKMLVEDIVRKSTPEERMALLEKDPRMIQYFTNPSLDEQRYVIWKLPHWKKYLLNPDEELVGYEIGAFLQHHPVIL